MTWKSKNLKTFSKKPWPNNIETDNIKFIPLSKEYLICIQEWHSDIDVQNFCNTKDKETIMDLYEWYATDYNRFQHNEKVYIFQIDHVPSGYTTVNKSTFADIEVGIVVDKNLRSRGLGQKVLRIFIDAFRDNSICARIAPNNKRAIDLVLALGFLHQKTLADNLELYKKN